MATIKELKARAEELGVAVPHEGAEPTKADYERALEAAAALVPGAQPTGETRTYVVRGPFPVFGVTRGNEVTGEVHIHPATGDELFIVGADYSVLKPMLEAGWLELPGEAEEEEAG